MSRPHPLLPVWPTCRHLPLLACAALGLRAVPSAFAQGREEQPNRVPVVPAAAEAPQGDAPAKAMERGFLGVSLVELRPEVRAQTNLKEGEGLLILAVAEGSPADKGGVSPYDILLRFNDQWIISEKQVATLVENSGPGCEVELTLLHRGKEKRAKVSLCLSLKPEERAKIRSLPLPPPPEEMMSKVMHTLRESPAALESVYHLLHGPMGSSQDGVSELREQTITVWDEGGQLELRKNGVSQHLKAWDGQGRLVYNGPCETPQQRADIPAEALVRLELLEKHQRNLRDSTRGSSRADTPPVAVKP